MPTGPMGEKRPADVTSNAVQLGREARQPRAAAVAPIPRRLLR